MTRFDPKAAKAMSPEILAELKVADRVLDCHIFDNPFFTGSPAERLPLVDAKAALERLHSDIVAAANVTGDEFQKQICAPLKQKHGCSGIF